MLLVNIQDTMQNCFYYVLAIVWQNSSPEIVYMD